MKRPVTHSTCSRKVGTHKDARLALRGKLQYCGGGVNRDVFVDPLLRVVYKVDVKRPSHQNANEEEFRRIAAIKRHDRTDVVPHATLRKIGGKHVLAMPYFPVHADDFGDDDAFEAAQAQVMDVASAHGLDDMHSENWRFTKGGRPRIVDYVGW